MRRIFILLALVCMLLPFASAEIIFSQPKQTYNLGDTLTLSASVNPTEDSEGMFSMFLICENGEKQFLMQPLNLPAGKEKKYELGILLSGTFTGNLRGDCYLKAVYNSETASSQNFIITDKLGVTSTLNKRDFLPGESVKISGTATKSSGKAEGFAELKVESLDISILSEVKSGNFNFNFTIPKNAKSGIYSIVIDAYEKDKTGKINEGLSSSEITLEQVATTLNLELSNKTFSLPNKVAIVPRLYDQAGDIMQGEIRLVVENSEGNRVVDKNLQSQEQVELDLLSDSPEGDWKASIYYFNLNSSDYFSVSENMLAEFELSNSTLNVKNIGNVAYAKQIQVKIGENTETIDITLPIGELKKYKLSAPDGQYIVDVSDGYSSLQGSSWLTGNAIKINESSVFSFINRSFFVWVFIIAVFCLLIFTMAKTYSRRNSFSGSSSSFSPPTRLRTEKEQNLDSMLSSEKVSRVTPVPSTPVMPVRKAEVPVKEFARNLTPVKDAEHSLVIDGERQSSCMLVISLKNQYEWKEQEFNTLNRAVEIAYDSKGSVHKTDRQVIIVFSPMLTKSYKNETTAIRVASSIARDIEEHNRKFKQRMSVGFGINSGDIAARIEDGKFKYTALGNTLILAKRVAESSNGEVLLSGQAYKNVMSDVKVLKKQGEPEAYVVKEVLDREQHKKFLDSFMKRNK